MQKYSEMERNGRRLNNKKENFPNLLPIGRNTDILESTWQQGAGKKRNKKAQQETEGHGNKEAHAGE